MSWSTKEDVKSTDFEHVLHFRAEEPVLYSFKFGVTRFSASQFIFSAITPPKVSQTAFYVVYVKEDSACITNIHPADQLRHHYEQMDEKTQV